MNGIDFHANLLISLKANFTNTRAQSVIHDWHQPCLG